MMVMLLTEGGGWSIPAVGLYQKAILWEPLGSLSVPSSPGRYEADWHCHVIIT